MMEGLMTAVFVGGVIGLVLVIVKNALTWLLEVLR